jgi:RHS repeat-associated protein
MPPMDRTPPMLFPRAFRPFAGAAARLVCVVAAFSVTGIVASAAPPEKHSATEAKPRPRPEVFLRSDAAEVRAHGDRISLRNLDLRRPPTEKDLIRSGQLGSPLSPSRTADPATMKDARSRARQESDNLLFGEAMQRWNEHAYVEAVELFKRHIARFPESPWNGEANLHLGCQAQFSGRWDEAETYFQRILQHEAVGSDIRQKAMLRLAVLLFTRNRIDESSEAFARMLEHETSWERRTYAQTFLRKLSLMRAHLQAVRNCGWKALACMLDYSDQGSKAAELASREAPGEEGFTLGSLAEAARSEGIAVEPVFSSVRRVSEIQTPFIAHYRDGHYVVVRGIDKEGQISVYDPRLERETMLSAAQMDSLWSGYALVMGGVPVGARLASLRELEAVAGGCCGIPRYPDELGSRGKPPCNGMPGWSVNPVNLNVVVRDTPMWYQAAVGPDFNLEVTYNSQDSLNQLRPFGNKWVSNLTSYALESPAQGGPGDVLIVMGDGRGDAYTPITVNGVHTGGYNPPTQGFNTLAKTGNFSFDLTLEDGTIQRYGVPSAMNGTSSLLLAIIDRHGNTLNLQHDSRGQISSVTTADNKTFTFHYDPAGRVSKVVDPWGREATFNYDAIGNLVAQTDMGNMSYGYTYDANVYLASIAKPDGTWGFYIEPADGINNASNPYPAPGGGMWDNYRVTITDPVGSKEEYYWNGYSRYGWHRDRIQYAGGGTPPEVPKTRFDFVQPGGNGTRGVLANITYASGNSTAFGNFTSDLQPRYVRSERGYYDYFTYNDWGRALTHLDRRGKTTTLEYATNGLDLRSVTNHSGRKVLDIIYHNGTRNIASVIRHPTVGQNLTTSYTYDSLGRLATETLPGEAARVYSYNATHKRLAQVTQNGVTLASYTYDLVGRTSTATDRNGLTRVFEYDGLNRVARIEYPDDTFEEFDYGCCELEQYRDRQGKLTTYLHDPVGRVVKQWRPDGVQLGFEYDAEGRLVALVDGEGNRTTWQHDDRGRITRKTYADGKSVQYARDGAGNAVSITNGRGQVMNLTYTPTDRLQAIIGANVSWSLTYDDFDNLATTADGWSNATWTHDDLGRLTGVNATRTGGGWTDIIAYTHDGQDRVIVETVNGVTRTRTYDGWGRRSGGGEGALGNFTVSFRDAASDLPVELAFSGFKRQFEWFNAVGDHRLRKISHFAGTGNLLVSRFEHTYDAGGRINWWKQEQPGVAAQEYGLGYDWADRLVVGVLRASGNGSAISGSMFEFDDADNRTLETVGGAVRRATHNGLNQLTGLTGGARLPIRGQTDEPVQSVTVNGEPARLLGNTTFEGYATVAPGNTTVTVRATDFGSPPNTATRSYRVETGNTTNRTLTYDDDGNMLSDGNRTYEWDGLNQLVAVNTGGNRSEFTYDLFGRRVQEIERTGNVVVSTRRLVWSGLEIREERDGSNNPALRFYENGFERVATPDAGAYFYSRDHLGSIREVVDASGAVRATYTYDLWGQRTKISGDLEARHGFTGHWFHTPSELHMAPYRAYSAEMGRWVSRDPIAERGGINLYGYAGNEPIRGVDPLGLWVITLRLNLTGILGVVGWDYSVGLAFDDEGNIVLQHSVPPDCPKPNAVALPGEPGVSATAGLTVTNADSVPDQYGTTYQAGVAAADGVAAEANFVWGSGETDGGGDTYAGWDFGAGVGTPGVQAQGTVTVTSPLYQIR